MKKICLFLLLLSSWVTPSFADDCSQYTNPYLLNECRNMNALVQQKQKNMETTINVELEQSQIPTTGTLPQQQQQPPVNVYQPPRLPQMQAPTPPQEGQSVIQPSKQEKKRSIYY